MTKKLKTVVDIFNLYETTLVNNNILHKMYFYTSSIMKNDKRKNGTLRNQAGEFIACESKVSLPTVNNNVLRTHGWDLINFS